jgi:hypothetical protein
VTELELELEPELGLKLSSLTTVTIVSIWMVMPMSAPLMPDLHNSPSGDLSPLTRM